MIQIVPVILGQPFVAHGPVKALDLGVLLRLSWLDVFELDPPLPGPLDDRRTQVFGAVVAANRQRLATPADDLLESTNLLFSWRYSYVDTLMNLPHIGGTVSF
jgi:hypothetical protein